MKWALLANALLFQLGWLVCVLGGNRWALVFTFCVLILHFSLYRHVLRDIVSIAVALIIGVGHDVFFMYSGLIDFGNYPSSLPPPWLVCLWVLMALTLNHSLTWIYERYWLSGLLGAIAGPASYWAGVALSPAQWSGSPLLVVSIMAALWLLILPLHRCASRRIESYVRTKISSVSHR